MIVLYGSGAFVTEIFGNVLSAAQWEELRHKARRLLATQGYLEAAELLEKLPFELRDGANDFNDKFAVLYAEVEMANYVSFKEDRHVTNASFRHLAETISELGVPTRFVAVELASADPRASVAPPTLQFTSRTVDQALSDAELLMRTNGPASAVDRVHTALHGYLKAVLDRASISYAADGSITQLYKILRTSHPDFSAAGARPQDVWKIVTSMAAAVDAVNVMRNRSSVAHPNAELLQDPEATLAINAARTLLHYLDSRICSRG